MFLAAFIMGFLGSLHCAVMCGPLVLAVPVVNRTRAGILASRVVYHAGRIFTYSLLGAAFGLIGQTLLLAGFQQWLSILAGVTMLAFLLLGSRGVKSPLWKGALWIKSRFNHHFQRRSFISLATLGIVNGLLPCGLVYMAGTASSATGTPLHGALYMLCFGLGTVPMMLAISLGAARLLPVIRLPRFKRIVPVAVSLIALSLIARGMALGIPYLSPERTDAAITCPACAH
jgi:sulfite exporter TauE/SafE